MSVEVKFYNFKKDSNSTKQPAVADLKLTASCEIFEPCNITRPRLILKVAAPKPTNGDFYNYAYISDFNRYYFITDWQYDTGLWYATCACDVLGTYKADIGAENLYILRASAASNGYIKDAYYPLTNQITQSSVAVASGTTFSSGIYVINVIGRNTGTSTLYVLSPSNFSTFLDALLGVIDGTTFNDVMQAIKNSIFDPVKYVTSVCWFPNTFVPSTIGTSLKVGLWDSGITAPIIGVPVQTVVTTSVTLPKHPQAARGQFLNAYPYTQYALVYEPFGVIELDASKCVGATSINISVEADALTGIGLLKVVTNTGNVLANVSAQYGVPLPLTGASLGSGAIASSVTSIGSLVAGAITGNAAMIAGGVAAGIDTAASSIRGVVSTVGGAGSVVSHYQDKTLKAVFHYVTGEDNSKNGRPYMQTAAPSAIPGFIMVQRGDVPINGTAAEADAIKALLEAGFYYE